MTGACRSSASSTRSHAFGVRADTAGDDHGIFGGDQHLRGFGHGAGIACGGEATVSLGIAQPRSVFSVIGLFLQTASATITTGPMGGVIAIL